MPSITDRAIGAFNKVTNLIFAVILLCLTLGLIIGTWRMLFTVWELTQKTGVTGQYIQIISDVLTLYILIELSRSLVDYFKCQRLRLTFIVDAVIVFAIREIMIKLFQAKNDPLDVYAFSALRIGAVLLFQRETRMVERLKNTKM